MAGMMELRRMVMEGSPYVFVNQIVGTGMDSRIDTGIPGNDDSLAFDLCFSFDQFAKWRAVFGNYISEDTNCWRLLQGGSDDGKFYFTTNHKAGSSSSLVSGHDTVVGKVVKAHLEYLRLKLDIEGQVKTGVRSNPPDGTENSTTIALGSSRVGAGGGGTVHTTWYYARISKGGLLVRDYRPCMRKQDGKYGFFETISKTFCPSIGSEDFRVSI
ncbi:MAG: hypothetical protein IJ899_12950 [Blautia sp.]|nr:hypothetical protein [Blautia sp.]